MDGEEGGGNDIRESSGQQESAVAPKERHPLRKSVFVLILSKRPHFKHTKVPSSLDLG